MKKLLFLPFLTLACFVTLSNSWGAKTYCVYEDIADNIVNGNQDGDNFLYLDTKYKNSGTSFYCGELKNTNGCDNATYIQIIGHPYMDRAEPKGWSKWKCVRHYNLGINTSNEWESAGGDGDISECDNLAGKELITKYGDYSYYTNKISNWEKYDGKYYYNKKNDKNEKVCKIETDKISELANKCEASKSWDVSQSCPNGTQFENAKTCCRGCPNGEYVYTIQLCQEGHTPKGPSTYGMGYDKCEKNASVVQEEDDDSESSFERCLGSRSTEEGRACCYLRIQEATYDSKTDKCKCKNGGTFKIAAGGRGTCEAPGGDGDDGRSVTTPDDDESTDQPVVTETYKCDPTKLAFISKWQIDCKDKQNIITQIEVINAHCNGLNPEKETFDTYYKMLQALNPDECAIENARKAAEEQIRAKKVQEFKSKFSTLEKIEGGFGDKSVWKNKDGKFNTARLASDSIAGVVLGTAGGLITSHVVKKNQEKSGFEDIKCTVGGQEIGDFGDQMNVGIN
ncbi:MAG: hypothetical protein J6K82_01685 [Alphaproteobacteria bacterium]|nr:hypothetical protein [Alphaproteobacteria bacterium]